MQFIYDFVDWITTFFTSIWDFITNIIDNLSMLFDYISLVAGMCYDFIAGFPDWLQAFGLITIVVCVLYMILGRDTGGKAE